MSAADTTQRPEAGGPFELHPRLQQDCHPIGRFNLCRLLLMRDANYPWFLLVPERPQVTEIFHLEQTDQIQLIRESSLLAAKLSVTFRADKINIAALGNLVPQLHLHHIVRRRDDAAWPAPVWGRLPQKPYAEQELSAVVETLVPALGAALGFVRYP